jgi:uncharacterized protein
MDNPLDLIGIRVLGALMEKEITTPDTYPLTLNALVTACNQTSNRTPVMTLDEATVSASLEDLSGRSLVREVHRSDSRAKRYRQTMSETLHLHAAETAAMCVLLLRGAQTAGEIRGRTGRLHEFRDTSHVELTLDALMTLSTPLVARLERQPGQKEVRYAHLMSGEPAADVDEAGTQTEKDERESQLPRDAVPQNDARAGRAGATAPAAESRIEALEEAVEAMRAELAEVRARFEEFRREFQ